jgi:CHAT domain-containing protein
LGAVPLGGCFWGPDGDQIYGVDLAAIKIAPSAVVQAACRRRATGPARDRLVSLADPAGWDPLPAARVEVQQIEQHFGGERATIGMGPDATKDFLAANAASAGYLHLACHARSDFEDFRRSRLFLADGELTLAEISGVAELHCRLAVASACESGRGQLDESADEMLSLGVALVAMGSAAAIATTWSIDDYATALLMTKLYEELADGQVEPAQALRAAQLWLRDLTETEHEQYLDDRPVVAAELRRRRSEDQRPGRRGSGTSAVGPFSHPDYWAAFALYGT